jgi:hypothetical protein
LEIHQDSFHLCESIYYPQEIGPNFREYHTEQNFLKSPEVSTTLTIIIMLDAERISVLKGNEWIKL